MRDLRLDNVIFPRLKSDYDYCVAQGYEVVGVFLFGSQNYNMHTLESDIDVKAIVIPNINDVVWGNTEISKKVVRDNGELVIYDIASVHKSIKKQSINFVEILFTEYKILNPEYAHLYAPMFEYREGIADLNTFKAVHCTLSMARNKHKMLFAELPSNSARVQKAGYDYKAFAEILRMEDFLNTRIAGLPYHISLISNNVNYLRKIKSHEIDFPLEQVKACADKALEHMSKRVDTFDEVYGENINEAMVELVDEVTKNIILRYIKTEVDKYDGADSTDWPAWCR